MGDILLGWILVNMVESIIHMATGKRKVDPRYLEYRIVQIAFVRLILLFI